MPGLDDVLERLVNEHDFREELTADPKRALAGYDLSPEDLDLLATQLSGGVGGLGSVEQRTTKAGLFGLFASMLGGGGGGGGMVEELNSDSLPDGESDPEWSAGGPGDDGDEVSEAVLLEQPSDDGDGLVNHDGGEISDVVVLEQPSDDGGGGPGGDLDGVMQKPPPEEGYGDDEGGGPTPGNPLGDGELGEPPDDETDPDGGPVPPGGDADGLMFKEVDPMPTDGDGTDDLTFNKFEFDTDMTPTDSFDSDGDAVGLNYAQPGEEGGIWVQEPSDEGGIELLDDEAAGPSPHM